MPEPLGEQEQDITTAGLDGPPQDDRPAGPASVWDQLRADHKRIAGERAPLELEVPGYHGTLVVRYRYVPLKDAAKNAQRLAKLRDVTEQALYASIDTLLLACEEILVRDQDTGELRSLAPEGEPPFRFDERFARGMGWEPGPTGFSARGICRKLFSNDYALIEQAREVSDWMSDSAREIGDDFLGG